MTRSEPLDSALEALSNQYRRHLLVALRESNPQDDDDIDPLDATTSPPPESECDDLRAEFGWR